MTAPESADPRTLQAAAIPFQPVTSPAEGVVAIPSRSTVSLMPLRSQSSGALMVSLRETLRHAEMVAVSDLRDEDRMKRLEARVLAAEKDLALAERDQAVRERDAALVEVGELRSRRTSPAPVAAVVESSRLAVVNMMEAAVTGRAAEALRRRTTEELLMGVATSDQTFRLTTLRSRPSCHCYDQSTDALTTGTPLPAAADHRALRSTVDKVLKSLSVGQPVNLDSHHIGDYDFDDAEDRELVDGARQTGRGNAATYRILEGSLSLDPRATAESQVRQNWPFSVPATAPAIAPATAHDTAQPRLQIVSTPPIALEEVVVTDSSATGRSPSSLDVD